MTERQRPHEPTIDDPQTGDSNEGADDEVEILQPDGSPAPEAS